MKLVMKADKLAYWYFRLNGFLTSQNYIIHRKDGSEHTEIDILGVRFPNKVERIDVTEKQFVEMEDAQIFKNKIYKDKIYIIIAEAKKGICDLNEPLINPDKKNINRYLSVVGAFKYEEIDPIAEELYNNGFFKNSLYYVSLFCVGRYTNKKWSSKYPDVPQITWDEVLEFIYNRLEKYEHYKHQHDQWDCDGKQLWNCFKRNKRDELNFKNEIISCLEQ